MATTKQVTEPANSTAANVTEPERIDTSRTYDPHKKVRVMDTKTKQVIRRPVPETWLDGRFPNLKAVPSSKKEGN